MNQREILLEKFNEFCVTTGRKPGGVSNAIARDGKFYDRILKGGDFNSATFDKAIKWFEENTPKKPNIKKTSKSLTL